MIDSTILIGIFVVVLMGLIAILAYIVFLSRRDNVEKPEIPKNYVNPKLIPKQALTSMKATHVRDSERIIFLGPNDRIVIQGTSKEGVEKMAKFFEQPIPYPNNLPPIGLDGKLIPGLPPIPSRAELALEKIEELGLDNIKPETAKKIAESIKHNSPEKDEYKTEKPSGGESLSQDSPPVIVPKRQKRVCEECEKERTTKDTSEPYICGICKGLVPRRSKKK